MSASANPRALVARVLAGDRLALARVISAVENDEPPGREVLEAVHPRVGRALRIGITGPPGAGKSTLVDAMTVLLRRGKVPVKGPGEKTGRRRKARVSPPPAARRLPPSRTVGILAVDPTSSLTGGALLGDRVRMDRHAVDRGVFIRSLATRGALGGVARAVWDAADLLDASGRGVVLIETVGVGQSEIEVAGLVDATVVVLSPESGDGIQAMKSGLLEVADLVVVNKSDRPGAASLQHELRAAYALGTGARRDTPVLLAQASEGKGVPEVLEEIERRIGEARSSGDFEARRRRHAEARLRAIVEWRLWRDLWSDPGRMRRLRAEAGAVVAGKKSPYRAAEALG